MLKPWNAIVIGAGAAGLFAAGILGQRGAKTLVIDHAVKLGEKIRISGGGRCNFTNKDSVAENFLSMNPAFVRSALSRYRPLDFISLVKSYRIAFHEKHQGQLFCDDSSVQIVNLLLSECAKGAVSIKHPLKVREISRESIFWRIQTEGEAFLAEHLVIATGGLPVPAIGATDFALSFARKMGLEVIEPRPGLVPLSYTSAEFDVCEGLAGVSLPVKISAGVKGARYGHASFYEDLLLTHKGLSGPAVLQASSYWKEGEPLYIDWSAGKPVARIFEDLSLKAKQAETVLSSFLPSRLGRHFADACGVLGKKWAEIGQKKRAQLCQMICEWQSKPAGTLGWKKAEVMLGGLDTRSLDSRTLQCKSHSGLYFIGECVDVTGHLGGHNFQWAWASGHACAQAIISAAQNP